MSAKQFAPVLATVGWGLCGVGCFQLVVTLIMNNSNPHEEPILGAMVLALITTLVGLAVLALSVLAAHLRWEVRP